MKPGPGDGDRLDPALDRGLGAQGGDQLGRDLARIASLRLGERHRRGDGEVAVIGLLGRLEGGGERVAGADFGHRRAQRVEQFFTGRHHRRNSTRRPRHDAAGNEKSRPSVNKVESAARPPRHASGANARMTVPTRRSMSVAAVRPRLCRSFGRGRGHADAHRQVPHHRPPRRRRDERGLPRLRRLPAQERRDQARARRRPPAIRSTATTRSASSPPKRRSSAGSSTRTSSRSSTPCPTRSRPTWSWSTSPAARCARTAAPTSCSRSS